MLNQEITAWNLLCNATQKPVNWQFTTDDARVKLKHLYPFSFGVVVAYRYEGATPGIEQKIIAMAANASGIRDTARVLRISTDKVMDTLKKRVN